MSDWKLKAACTSPDVDPDWWSEKPGLAVHVCQRHCPVRAACDADAEGKVWRGLVVAGYARTETWGRALRQPVPDRSGCPWCPTVPPPRVMAGAGDVSACEGCGRMLGTLSGGRHPRHFKPDMQTWCS